MTNQSTIKDSIRKLHGGVIFNKAITPPITHYPTPPVLNISLIQHQGLAGQVIVKIGDVVLKGQALTQSMNLNEVPVHASASGTVIAISHSRITIKTNYDKPLEKNTYSPQLLTADQLSQLLHQHGLAGLGGAGYPTAQKLAQLKNHGSVLLINAAECDPLIHCDNALMCDKAAHIIEGIKIIAESCSIERVIIGIEDNKPAAIKCISTASSQAGFNAEIITVPSVYPSGAEKILLKLCGVNNKPSTEPLAKQGFLCLNIATCYAAYQALVQGIPLISRITTIVDAEGTIRNFEIPIGTPIDHIYKTVHNTHKLPDEKLIEIVIGGKMMGRQVSLFDATIKSTNCIVFTPRDKKTLQPTACIRCGACADICPAQLLPQQLYTFAVNFNATVLEQYQLSQCVECACCDTVCPSHLPLTQYFVSAKQRVTENDLALQQAKIARYRFEKREKRLASGKANARNTSANRQTRSPQNNESDTTRSADAKKALIEAALKRKKTRRPSKNPNGNQSSQS